MATITTANSKKDLKRDSIVAEAVNQLNERGLSFLSLNSVAVSMGLSRNTLYYYFKNREDLIFSCYRLAAETAAEELDSVITLDKSAAVRIEHFVAASLKRESVAIGDLTQLNLSHRESIKALQAQNEIKLQAIIGEGIEQGRFRKVDPVIASQVLISFISWHQLSGLWFNTPKDEQQHGAAAERISDMLLNGVCRDTSFKYKYHIDYEALQTPEFNAFDADSLNTEKRRQLIGHASMLFNRRGIDAVSLEDVARYIGTSKGAVYHYFKDKPSLIRACYESAFKLYDNIIDASIKECATDLDALLSVNHLNCQAQNSRFPPLILQPGEAVFYDVYHQDVNRLAEKIHVLRRECFREKTLREVSEDSIELSSGAHFWISQWLSNNPEYGRRLSSIELADEVTGIIAHGVFSKS